MRIYDTLSESKKALKKTKKPLKLFVCGPTAYDHSHIGHARTYLVFDAFAKYLKHRGFKVFYLQNITDIDDKIIKKSKDLGQPAQKIARAMEKNYFTDMKALKITAVDKYARASEHIFEIQRQIKTLLKKGFAYQTKNGIYFEIKKSKHYGRLSKQNLSELRPGYRIEPDRQKKDPLDFALWKITPEQESPGEKEIKNLKSKIKNYEPLWPSPWGWGRPGWHIEDTAISEKYFGPQYDIHGGGADLKFPHHESEIAQQESASGKNPFVKIWMHTGFLLVFGEKMSKSLGNFLTIKDFLKPLGENGVNILRWLVFSAHYRSPLDYSPKLAAQARHSLDALAEFLEKLRFTAQNSKTASRRKFVLISLKKFEKEFYSSLDDDFNIPAGLAAVFNLMAAFQKKIWGLSKAEAKTVEKELTKRLKILEIELKPAKIPAEISKIARQREKMRNNKQFIPADRLRKKIERLGYKVDDTPLGPFVRSNRE